MSFRNICGWFFMTAMLEVDALFVVIVFRDLVRLLEMRVLSPFCLSEAAVN